MAQSRPRVTRVPERIDPGAAAARRTSITGPALRARAGFEDGLDGRGTPTDLAALPAARPRGSSTTAYEEELCLLSVRQKGGCVRSASDSGGKSFTSCSAGPGVCAGTRCSTTRPRSPPVAQAPVPGAARRPWQRVSQAPRPGVRPFRPLARLPVAAWAPLPTTTTTCVPSPSPPFSLPRSPGRPNACRSSFVSANANARHPRYPLSTFPRVLAVLRRGRLRRGRRRVRRTPRADLSRQGASGESSRRLPL